MNLEKILTLGNIAISLAAIAVALTLIVGFLASRDHKNHHH